MRAVLCFMFLVFSAILIVDSLHLTRTIKLLHKLGPKRCPHEVEKANSARFKKLTKKKQELPLAIKISYNFTFGIFKRSPACWSHEIENLRNHLNRQNTSNACRVPDWRARSSDLLQLFEDFQQLGDFLSKQNQSCCAWEIARNELFRVFDHLWKMSSQHRRRMC